MTLSSALGLGIYCIYPHPQGGDRRVKSHKKEELDQNRIVEYIQKLDDMAYKDDNGNEVIRLKNSGDDQQLSNEELPWASISSYELTIAPMKHRYIYEIENEHHDNGTIKKSLFKNVGIEYNPNFATLIAANTYEIMRSLLKDTKSIKQLQQLINKEEFNKQREKLSETAQDALAAYMKAFEGETINNAGTKTGNKIENESKLLEKLFNRI